jgi:hypothetical protein
VSQRLVVVAQILGAFFFCLLEFDRAGADRHAVAVFQRMFEFLFAVDVDLVRATMNLAVHVVTIDDQETAIVTRADVRVMTRRAWVIQHDLIVGRAPDRARGLGR